MRLRYLHLQNYPPIKNIHVAFASDSPLQRDLGRECAIRFVVGVNGSGKSNLLRAVAEVFLALADERLPPFPVSLFYELGQRGSSSHYSFLIDCPGSKADASIWMSSDFHWPDNTPAERFKNAIELIRADTDSASEGFAPLVPRGTWPQQPGIAMPKAVLAYTTGDLHPWRSVWSRNQDAQGFLSANEDVADANAERPAGWTAAQEAALESARQTIKTDDIENVARFAAEPALFRRPILLNATLLKCALLAVALPQAYIETANYPDRTSADAAMARLRGTDDNKNALQELLERGGWHHMVSVGFRTRFQPREWDQKLCETAHDWFLCAGEVIAEPHPSEARRTLFFDLKGSFNGQDTPTRQSNDWLATCTTQGEALWALLGGVDATAFELFTRLLELNQSGLFDDVLLRLRRQPMPTSDDDLIDQDADIGVLRYEELSDGEQMVLGRMALFHLLHGQHDALLLLDEPETHFNDKWKREIVDIIDEAIGDTANDVLISTHSAIVLSDVFNDEIVMVEKTKIGSAVRPVNEPTFATDPSALMMTVFGADDSIGKRAEEYIKKKLEQTSGSPADIVELERLISRMGSGFYRSELRTLLNIWRGVNA